MSETNVVRHLKLDITLDLARPDLGHPEQPDLWEELRKRPVHRGELRCMGRCFERDPNNPQWVYLRERQGQRQAVHLNPGARANHAGESESDEHKALKERGYKAAISAGLRATVEEHAPHGKRITDLVIEADGHRLGVEYQRSLQAPARIKSRVAIARADGLTPFWATDNPELKIDYRAPFARFNGAQPYEILAGASLRVVSGYDKVAYERCGWKGPRCPVSGGPRCGKIHAYRLAASIELDELQIGAATRVFLPLQEPKKGGGFNHRWLRAEDLERYLDDRNPGSALAVPTLAPADRAAGLACNQRGGLLPPLQGQRAGNQRAGLNWSKHAVGEPQPCRICRKPAFMRDEDGRPCHKVCAESQIGG
ncbi:competence protein CoiA-like protein [Micromonospora sp. M71_S20]|uniref:competence protein CoiA family protein n=1 Tax=Micromonospora sp. M71_S20 TaxID=592872 RepID=UPI000F291E6B|nr:competence protein CoiA family protein [Micromonospora sp. M71_S20]RLK13308.1 competence protein CoiA-like protein [Micromonospora sp. M71_S20]